MKKLLPILALLLLVIWIVARITVAVTGFLLHLIWILAVLLFIFWILSLAFSKGKK